jgi:hypothetical protein
MAMGALRVALAYAVDWDVLNAWWALQGLCADLLPSMKPPPCSSIAANQCYFTVTASTMKRPSCDVGGPGPLTAPMHRLAQPLRGTKPVSVLKICQLGALEQGLGSTRMRTGDSRQETTARASQTSMVVARLPHQF